MIKWSPKQLRERLDEISGMMQGFTQMSPTEFSYVLTGDGEGLRLSKIRHPGPRVGGEGWRYRRR
jgi:hypothetical protein